MATTGTVDAEARRARILDLLSKSGRVRIDEAASALDVSAMTVRRDLADLEAEGMLRRVRGGAVASARPRSFTERMATGAEAKLAIARKVQHLLPLDGAIAADASSTVGVLLSQLPDDTARELLVATNSHENFQVARRAPGATAILVGGEAEPRTDSFVGPIACAAARSLHYRRFFTSASALEPERGAFEVTMAEAQVKAAFAESADETILLADSAKLGQTALALGLPWQRISLLVTELDPHDPALAPYRELVAIL